MARQYFTLVIQDGTPTETPWAIAFGDYDREPVEAELDDYRDHGWKRSQLRIIKTSARQRDISAAVDALNAAKA